MGFNDDLQTNAAGIATDILDPNALGSSLTYKHRDGTSLNLVGRAGPEDKTITTMLGLRVEVTNKTFWIPYQPLAIGAQGPAGPQGFPYPNTTGPSEFDKIIFKGLTYYIQSYTVDSVEALYKLHTTRWQATKIGVE